MWGVVFLLIFLLFSGKGEALERKPVVLEVSPEGAFLVERWRISPKDLSQKVFSVPGRLRMEDLHWQGLPEKCFLEPELVGYAVPEGGIFPQIEALEKEERSLQRKLEALKFQEDWLRKISPEKGKEPLSLGKRIAETLQGIWERRAELQERWRKIQEEKERLRSRAALKEVSLFSLRAIGCPEERSWTVYLRYPVPTVGSEREKILEAYPDRGLLLYGMRLLLRQRLGQELGPIRVIYHLRPPSLGLLEPPPFTPWYLGEERKREDKMRLALAPKGLPSPKKEETLLGKRYRLEDVVLSPGVFRVWELEREMVEADFWVDIPVYALPQAFLAVSFVAETYFPAGLTRVRLGDMELPRRYTPAFIPGRKYTFYLGPDPWMEVKKELLKDFEEKIGLLGGKRRRTQVWRTEIRNGHRRKISVRLRDRIPVSRREEIRVRATAEPPWDEISPSGEVFWRLELSPGETRVFILRIITEYPSP